MKICEIISEDLQAGAGGVGGGDANAETMIMQPPQRHRRMKQIPQVGYGIKIGNKVIPTPGYVSDNDRGTLNKVNG